MSENKLNLANKFHVEHNVDESAIRYSSKQHSLALSNVTNRGRLIVLSKVLMPSCQRKVTCTELRDQLWLDKLSDLE